MIPIGRELHVLAEIVNKGKVFTVSLQKKGIAFGFREKDGHNSYGIYPSEDEYEKFWKDFLGLIRRQEVTPTLRETNIEGSVTSRMEVGRSGNKTFLVFRIFNDWSEGTEVFSMEVPIYNARQIFEECKLFIS